MQLGFSKSANLVTRISGSLLTVLIVWNVGFASSTSAQTQTGDTFSRYALVPRKVMRPRKVITYKYVDETTYVTEKTTNYKPVWKMVDKERVTTEMKPVVETKYRDEKRTTYKRVVETAYRDEIVEETSYETRIEMQDRKRIVEKPVLETQYRDEKVVVQKPVTETQMQSEDVTYYKPVKTTETQYTQGYQTVNQLTYQPGAVRNRLQFLRPGYYPNGYGGMDYKTGGLYWVPQQNVGGYRPQTTVVPTVTPQQIEKTQLVPEVVTRQKPVQVTKMVDTIETRRVPYQTETMRQQVVVDKVPVEVQVPVVRKVVKKVPYEKVTLVPETVVEKVPYEVTRYEKVETVEPFQERVQEYVAETSERQVPKTVTRRIPVETTEMVEVTEMVRVPVDNRGYPLQSVTAEKPAVVGEEYRSTPSVVPLSNTQVVEGSTLNSQFPGKTITVRDARPKVKVDDANLRSVFKPSGDRTETQKPPLPEKNPTSVDEQGDLDKVDLKKSNDGDNGEAGEPKAADGAPEID